MGKYTKIKADGGPIKGKKKPAIKVSDPFDLNLHAYLDSSNLHNAYLEQLKYNPPVAPKDLTALDIDYKNRFKNKTKNEQLISFSPKKGMVSPYKSKSEYLKANPAEAPLIDAYENLNFKGKTQTGYWTTPDLSHESIAPIDVYTGEVLVKGKPRHGGNPVYAEPTQPYEYTGDINDVLKYRSSPTVYGISASPHQEKLNINSIQYNPKDTNPYNKYVVNRYLPTPQSPVNPLPYDDIQLYSGHQNRDNQGLSVGYVMEDGKRRDIMADEYNAIMGSSVQGGTKLENTDYAMGGMIKRKDGSYSKRGLWDNIRANKGSGKAPTKEMLKQERKIKAKYADGGPLDRNKLKEYIDLYGFGSGEDSAGDGYDFIYNNLITKHGLDPDNAAKYTTAILSPLEIQPNSFTQSTENNNAVYTAEDMDLYTGDTDMAEINKYRPTKQLTAKKPFGYKENFSNGEQEYGKGGPINPLEGDLISKVIMNRNRDKDFVQRAYAVGDYPNSNMFTSPDPDNFGSRMSHKMEYGEDDKGQTYMYPSVMNPKNEDIKIPKQYADYISSVGYKKATGMPYAMGGRMNQAQQLNQGKMRVGSGEGNGLREYASDYGNFLLDGITGVAEGITGAEIYNPNYNTKLGKIAGAVNNQSGKMIGKFAPMALNAVAPGVGTAVGVAGKAIGTGLNASKNEQSNEQLNLGNNSMLPNVLGNNTEGIAAMEQMGASMKMAQGGLMHINEGGTHEQNALGGVPIGPNALVEQGETINNDFVFSDRLKPKGSKKTYAQLSKSVDTKYRLRPDDKLSKEAKQMDLDRLAMQQEAQKDEMSTKYMQKAMACGGKIKGFGGSFQGPISQSMNVTNGQNTLLAMGGNLPNYDYGDDGNIRRSPYNNMVNAVDNGINNVNYRPSNDVIFNERMKREGFNPTLEDYNKVVLRQQQAAYGGSLMSNFMEQPPVYQNPANQYATGGNMYGNGGGPIGPLTQDGQFLSTSFSGPDMDETYLDENYLDDLRAQHFKSNPNMDQTVYSNDDFPVKDYSYLSNPQYNDPNYSIDGYFKDTNRNQYYNTKVSPSYSSALNRLETNPAGQNYLKQIGTVSGYTRDTIFNNLDPDVIFNRIIDNGVDSNTPINIESKPYYTPNTQVKGRDVQPYNSEENNLAKQMQGTSNPAQNEYPEVGNTGYLTNLAGNLVKAGMVATSKPPIYNPSVKFGRMNANPAERLAMQEGRREIQGTKDIIRNNATSSGQYLTNASLMGSNAANKLAGTIGGIRQQYDTQNVGIGNQEAQVNQQITAANNLAKETFRDNRLNQYNKILDSVIGANQQRFATDVHANNYQNQAISMLKTKDFHVGRKDKNGMFEVLDINGNIVGTLDNNGVAKDLQGNLIK